MDAQRRHSWMWAEACALLDLAERRQRRFFDLAAAPAAAPAWEPPANIVAADSELHVSVALPGARAEDVVVQITPTGLLIDAVSAPPAFERSARVVRLEIPYGRMRRRIDLPAGHYVLLERRLQEGVLFLRLAGAKR